MANFKITDLPAATALTGSEPMEAVQGGVSVQTTSGAINLAVTGTGSPETVVTAPVGKIYFDLTDTGNPGMWVKATGIGNTGWTQILG
jgi:hypothetical protein